MGKRSKIFFDAIRKMNAGQIAIYLFLFAFIGFCAMWTLHNFHVIPWWFI